MGQRGSSVDDPFDERLAAFLGLRDHQGRQARERPGGDMSGVFMAEGVTVIERALSAGHHLQSVLVDRARPRDVLSMDLPANVDLLLAGPEVLEAVSGRRQLRDAIACFDRPQPVAVDDVLGRARTVAVLEGVVNPTNMGVIARCAAGLGCDALLVDPTSVDPLYRRCVRVSMGEVFAIPHARLPPFPDGLDVLTRAGFSTVALTPANDAIDIADYRRESDERIAVLLGAEGAGLSDATMGRADCRVRIPMAAGVDSINVGAAAAIAFHMVAQVAGRT